ncbi:MAG: hypothetical protein KDG55_22295 [Rhodocyclaceae bacterium]|nr:hypothetical protein [Rhodocyclaceae bacterium]
MEEKQIFERIARELSAGRMERPVWAKALADAGGDEGRARTLYIRARTEQLRAQPDAGPVSGNEGSGIAPLRARLVALLADTGKGSFYTTLGVSADASDEAVAEAIERARQGGADGAAEMRYAFEALGDPGRRETYDRRLLGQLTGEGRAAAGEAGGVGTVAASEGVGRGFRIFPHGLIAVAVLAGGVAFAMHAKEEARRKHEAVLAAKAVEDARKAEEARQRAEQVRLDVLRQKAEIEERESDRAAREQADALAASKAMLELERDVLKERRLVEEKREREEKARVQAELDAIMAKEEAERKVVDKARREREYWSCLNKALNDMGRDEAKAKCDPVREGTS